MASSARTWTRSNPSSCRAASAKSCAARGIEPVHCSRMAREASARPRAPVGITVEEFGGERSCAGDISGEGGILNCGGQSLSPQRLIV